MFLGRSWNICGRQWSGRYPCLCRIGWCCWTKLYWYHPSSWSIFRSNVRLSQRWSKWYTSRYDTWSCCVHRCYRYDSSSISNRFIFVLLILQLATWKFCLQVDSVFDKRIFQEVFTIDLLIMLHQYILKDAFTKGKFQKFILWHQWKWKKKFQMCKGLKLKYSLNYCNFFSK